jgi:quercetin dioxygenase-like cupin family protein
MSPNNAVGAGQIIDPRLIDWGEDSRFAGVLVKTLLTAAANPQASVHLVRVPAGGMIGHHQHEHEIETAYVVKGSCTLELNGVTHPFYQGQIVVIAAGVEHAVFNNGVEAVEFLTLFTPPRS